MAPEPTAAAALEAAPPLEGGAGRVAPWPRETS